MAQPHFHNIIGHEVVQDVLSRMIQNNHLPHAFLFVGSHHVGKTLVAKQLMKELMNEGGQGGKGGYGDEDRVSMDMIELECLTDEKTGKKKTQISVEQVRDVCERLAMSSMHGGWKIAFVKEANALSHAAANALLKTLEEPKGKALFILRAPSQESVLATIASRCQVVRFHPVTRKQLSEALVKKGYAKPDAESAAAISFGRPGKALRFLTRSEDRSQMEIGVKQADELFATNIAIQIQLVSSLLPKEDVNKRVVADQTIRLWQGILRDQLLKEIGCGELVVYSDGRSQEVKKRRNDKDLSSLIKTLKKTEEAREAILHNTNPQLTLEYILFSV